RMCRATRAAWIPMHCFGHCLTARELAARTVSLRRGGASGIMWARAVDAPSELEWVILRSAGLREAPPTLKYTAGPKARIAALLPGLIGDLAAQGIAYVPFFPAGRLHSITVVGTGRSRSLARGHADAGCAGLASPALAHANSLGRACQSVPDIDERRRET